MPTVYELIQRLTPNGTNRGREDWDDFPIWPPDAFAIAATLVDRSGCYAHPHFSGGTPRCSVAQRTYLRFIRRMADRWQKGKIGAIQTLWQLLADPRHGEVASGGNDPQPWWDFAVKLLMIADEASRNIGFASTATPFATNYVQSIESLYDNRIPDLPFPENTLCDRVSPSELCVQPKTVTAQAGITLRSLTHNLALLPGWGEVKTSWKLDARKIRNVSSKSTEPLNLLVVPFPYQLEGMSFKPSVHHYNNSERTRRKSTRGHKTGFFEVSPDWLWLGTDGELSDDQFVKEFTDFLGRLIGQASKQARREVGAVHGIVLPELALERSRAGQIAELLARRYPELELFITGFHEAGGDSFPSRNGVHTALFNGEGGILRNWDQNKHHRWKLERDQINRYDLGARLDGSYDWWEHIDVSRRECVFRVFRRGSCLAALVCEDLARIDPVQTVIRSVGPNLVIALLMDGPQLERRWSGRYATVLADDPGSSVLTVTSLGLMRRQQARAGDVEPRQVAMWKEAGGSTRELALQKDHQALLLTLTMSGVTNYTLDGRSDYGGTMRLSLTGVRQVQDPDAPAWSKER